MSRISKIKDMLSKKEKNELEENIKDINTFDRCAGLNGKSNWQF